MKKLIGLIAICAIMAGCGDDDGDGTTNLSLTGTSWTLTQEITTGCDDSSENGTFACTSDCEVLVVGSSGTLTLTDSDGTETIDYTISGNVITVSFDDGGGTETIVITYVIVGDQLTLTFTSDFGDGCIGTNTYTGS